jgi:hypothetical protein
VARPAERLLLDMRWDPSAAVLHVHVVAFAGQLSDVVASTDGDRTTIELVRTPAPTVSSDCIAIEDPPPFSRLTATAPVSGTATLFEGGPMTLVARVPGQGQAQTTERTAVGGQEEPFTAHLPLPDLAEPAEGYIAAFEPSAKDGSPTCTVKVPVYFDPGGG